MILQKNLILNLIFMFVKKTFKARHKSQIKKQNKSIPHLQNIFKNMSQQFIETIFNQTESALRQDFKKEGVKIVTQLKALVQYLEIRFNQLDDENEKISEQPQEANQEANDELNNEGPKIEEVD